MPRNKLTVTKVRNAPAGKYNDGAGLWLVKRGDGGQWVLRVTIHGRRREMGLGSIYDVSLEEAREEADKARKLVRQGFDPIKERVKRKRETAKAAHTFSSVLDEVVEKKRQELKREVSARQWDASLRTHILPKIGGIPVTEIDGSDIANALRPIWHEKSSTALKAINRVRQVMTHAAALGLQVDLQAVDKARALLGRQKGKSAHIKAMLFEEVPNFFQSLGGNPAELALKLLILTGVRSRPIRYLERGQLVYDHAEVAGGGSVWEIPADLRKAYAHEPFRVPLSDAANRVIEQASPLTDSSGFVFVSTRGKPLSDAAMARVLDRRGISARPHGFRSSLRNWCEREAVRYEVAEMLLDHVVGSKVERAYRRDDLMLERREVLERWATFVTGAK